MFTRYSQPAQPDCVCGHSEVTHDMTSKGQRGRCGRMSGAHGLVCTCTRYTPTSEADRGAECPWCAGPLHP